MRGYISREEFERRIKPYDTNDPMDKALYNFAHVMMIICPSVEPERKAGHWIENAPEYQNIDPPYICSECGNMHLRKTNYCDQCGCRMVEPQESEVDV